MHIRLKRTEKFQFLLMKQAAGASSDQLVSFPFHDHTGILVCRVLALYQISVRGHIYLLSLSSFWSSACMLQMASSSTKESVVPWVEKYRPMNIDEVVYQDEVTRALKSALSSGD